MLRHLGPVGAILLGLVFSGTAEADQTIGRASVVDGDTLEVHGVRVRLWGIDAPEVTQLCRDNANRAYRCGAKAANELDAFLASHLVTCTSVGHDRYGRSVAICSVGGVDLGDWLVSNGLALDWPKFSRGRYGQSQRDAQNAGRGMWSGSFVLPWVYRACMAGDGTPNRCSEPSN